MSKKDRFNNLGIDNTADRLFIELPAKESEACSATKKAVVDVLRANADLAPER